MQQVISIDVWLKEYAFRHAIKNTAAAPSC